MRSNSASGPVTGGGVCALAGSERSALDGVRSLPHAASISAPAAHTRIRTRSMYYGAPLAWNGARGYGGTLSSELEVRADRPAPVPSPSGVDRDRKIPAQDREVVQVDAQSGAVTGQRVPLVRKVVSVGA